MVNESSFIENENSFSYRKEIDINITNPLLKRCLLKVTRGKGNSKHVFEVTSQ